MLANALATALATVMQVIARKKPEPVARQRRSGLSASGD
jgi:hypothetical protein